MADTDFSFDPFKMFQANMAFWADATEAMQKQMAQTTAAMMEQMPDMMSWDKDAMASMNPAEAMSENRMREMFQTMADTNLTAWTHTANMLSAMPSWMHMPTQVPGRAMADMFDKFKAKPGRR